MLWSTLLALAALTQAAPSSLDAPAWLTTKLSKRQGGTTMLRFGCAQVVIDRLDPLVNPGQAPSPHQHQIVGGNGFNMTMTTGDVSKTASCTTCAFSKDLSNYWTANLYFKSPKNGTYKRVKQLGAAKQFNDDFSTKIDGGVLVYYVSAQPGKVKAFPQGFRMLSGDPTNRKADPKMKMQNCYRCYTGPNFGGDTAAPCAGGSNLDTQQLPSAPCKGGIRSNILFPTCWDGVNLDSPDHKSHVAYPTTGPANFLSLGGSCPTTHPVRIPQLMYEVVWDTTPFNSEWKSGDANPFYLSYGDNTGLGQHADYVFGWQDDELQKGMDATNCMGAKCKDLKNQAIDNAKKCNVKRVVQDELDTWHTEIPGMSGPMDMH